MLLGYSAYDTAVMVGSATIVSDPAVAVVTVTAGQESPVNVSVPVAAATNVGQLVELAAVAVPSHRSKNP